MNFYKKYLELKGAGGNQQKKLYMNYYLMNGKILAIV